MTGLHIINSRRPQVYGLAALALAIALAGCGEHANRADEAAASHELKKAGNELTAAVKDTGRALNHEAEAAKPGLQAIGADADRGAAKLADATGQAAHKAGAAIDKAGEKADLAAHRAGDQARDHAENAGTD